MLHARLPNVLRAVILVLYFDCRLPWVDRYWRLRRWKPLRARTRYRMSYV